MYGGYKSHPHIDRWLMRTPPAPRRLLLAVAQGLEAIPSWVLLRPFVRRISVLGFCLCPLAHNTWRSVLETDRGAVYEKWPDPMLLHKAQLFPGNNFAGAGTDAVREAGEGGMEMGGWVGSGREKGVIQLGGWPSPRRRPKPPPPPPAGRS